MTPDVALSAKTASPIVSDKKYDTTWILALYGTAIGAGTLFLPIDAGTHGIWPLIFMAIVAFPMTYLPHRALCRFVQSGSSPTNDFTDVVKEHFGALAGHLLTVFYFLSIYPILLMYGVALTNTTLSFITQQLGLQAPPRALLSFVLVFTLMAVVRLGQDFILRAINLLVYPFISVLMLLAAYLVPHWNTAIFTQTPQVMANAHSTHGIFTTLWLLIPVMVFSFSHSPIISTFAISQRERFGQDSDRQSARIMKYSHLMMVGSVMFFVFSCVLSLSPHDLAMAKQQNITILSYLANHFDTPLMAYIAPVIAFLAISKSFLGHYLGAREGMHGLIAKLMSTKQANVNHRWIKHFIEVFMLATCWFIATVNPNILGMIESLVGPLVAFILFVMPMYAISKVPALQRYHRTTDYVFVMGLGLIAISALVYGIVKAFGG